jgi:glycogen debranching enzyme
MPSKELREKVRAMMLENKVEGYSKLLDAHYSYIAPSKDRYQFQWFWDTCFHIFILCALDEMFLAKANLRSLFRMQEDDGFVGHMIFWNQILPHNPVSIVQAKPTLAALRPHMSALIQPPLVAQALRRIYKKSNDRLFLYEMLPKIIRYHEWLAENRDLDGDGLISIFSPSESGIDWKPSFDEVVGKDVRSKSRYLLASKLFWHVATVDVANFLRGYQHSYHHSRGHKFAVKEVTVNTTYACDLRALSELCLIANLQKEAQLYERRAEKVGTSILNFMYDNRSAAFFDITAKSNIKLRVLTAMSFIPMILPEISDKISGKMIERHLDNEREFLSKYPIPSVAMNDPSFNPEESLALWRGPTWPVMNWFIYHSLREKGFVSEAARLRLSLRTLIEKSGFREYYNPQTGEGYGAKNFTWSGLIVDMDDSDNETANILEKAATRDSQKPVFI